MTERVDAPSYPMEQIELALVDDFESNPQYMTDDQFSRLVEEIAESGWLVPLQVVGPTPEGRYKMQSGHHRRKAAEVLGYTHVPAMVLDPDQFDDDVREVQVVRQNVLGGQLDPEKFTKLFNRLAERYGAEMTQTMMAFTQKDAFKKVYLDAKKALPPGMQEELEKVRDELKTVDDLSLVLNRLFSDYGNTLDSNFMFLSWGGRSHLMVQMQAPGAWQRFEKFAKWCQQNHVKMDEEMMSRMDWPNLSMPPTLPATAIDSRGDADEEVRTMRTEQAAK